MAFATLILLAVIFSITQQYNLNSEIDLRSVVEILYGDTIIFLHILNHIFVSSYPKNFHRHGITFNTLNNDFLHISNKKGHFGYPSLSQDLKGKPN